MTFSNLVMLAIMMATAQTIHGHGRQDIQSAADAAQALRPVAGPLAGTLFALGFIGSGLLAIPVLAGAGSVGMAGLLGKRSGFSRSISQAPIFYALVGMGTLGGTVLSLLHANPIKLLVLVAVINGIAAAPFLVVVMCISGNRALMGSHVNGRASSVLGWATAGLMAVAAIAMFATGGI
jgi:Mn2+/Fe2+ NRAMP family transporter